MQLTRCQPLHADPGTHVELVDLWEHGMHIEEPPPWYDVLDTSPTPVKTPATSQNGATR